MTPQKKDELLGKLATAMGLLTEVQKALYSEMGYRRGKVGRAIAYVTQASDTLLDDWERDERELDEDIASFRKGEP